MLHMFKHVRQKIKFLNLNLNLYRAKLKEKERRSGVTEVPKRKGKRSASVLWQRSLHQQKLQKKAKWQHKNLDYTTIVGRLRAVSWSNYTTGVVKPVYGIPTFQLIVHKVQMGMLSAPVPYLSTLYFFKLIKHCSTKLGRGEVFVVPGHYSYSLVVQVLYFFPSLFHKSRLRRDYYDKLLQKASGINQIQFYINDLKPFERKLF